MRDIRVISGYVDISEQLLQQALDTEEAIRAWEKRMESDPEFAAKWRREQDERDADRGYDW